METENRAGRLMLNDATEVRLTALNQGLTYDGLLEGLPTTKMNASIVKRLRETNPKALLVAPQETPIKLERRYPFGTPASIPGTYCIGTFQGPGKSDPALCCTELTVLWFQDSWALPIADAAVEQLRALDWFRVAEEYEL